MSDRRQKNQLELTFMSQPTGEARGGSRQGTESLRAKDNPEHPAARQTLMEEVCETKNLKQALRRIKANRGSAGIDGMQVEQLAEHLIANWATLREQLRKGTYKPQPVKRVEIDKPDGGKRKLGIPTVLDRFVQQAVSQVLQKQWDHTFSPHSHGFRENHSAHGAVSEAQGYIAEGYGWVVDLDLEKFFDRVNHDRLMSRIATRIGDERMLKLIRGFLKAGVMEQGLVSPSTEGTPQGGPLSPLLSNIVLDELDRELARRGHKFVRYADDCNIYVKSRRAGQRVMDSIGVYITRKLRLRINGEKSAVGKPHERMFLGFSFTAVGAVRRRIASKSLKRFERRVRQLTRRTVGASLEQVIAKLNEYTQGWYGYFGFSEARSVLKELDAWTRRRLRALIWTQWKTYKRRYGQLLRRGIRFDEARGQAGTRHGPWRTSNARILCRALPNTYFDTLGLFRLYGNAA